VRIRPGEKRHEEMITISDFYNTMDFGKYYVILLQQPIFTVEEYKTHFKAKAVSQGFSYDSRTNDQWEIVESLRALVKEHVDPIFTV
jgi:UDP-N-acetylglucosamine 4,6-dehydratase/5-epimerase